jgi:thiol:disulfide interchange protein
MLVSIGCDSTVSSKPSMAEAPPSVAVIKEKATSVEPLIVASPTTEKSTVVETKAEPKAPDAVTHASFYSVDQYGEDRNAEDDLKMTMARAAKEKKNIILQVGGEWCGWCKLLTGFIEKTDTIRSSLDQNFVLMKVTYTQKQPNEAFLSKFPKVKGYPHLFVLDADGKLLHSQDTEVLEEGKGYNESKIVEFLDAWKPKSK